jgi:hypothetical protein
MNNLVETVTDIGNSLNTMCAVSNQIETSKKQLSEIARSIEEQHVGLVANTMSCSEACAVLGITEPTLIKRRKAGLVPFIKLGRNFYYLKTEAAVCSK